MKNLRLIQLALLVSITMVIVSCSQKGGQAVEFEKVQHFRSLLFSETPWDQIRGNYKITSEQAKTINNFKFTYNDDEKLVRVEFGRGDSLLAYSNLGAARVEIKYEGNKEIRHYFDKNGNPKTISKNVFKSVYEYNESGFKTGLKFYGEDGQPVENRNNIAYYTWSKTPVGMVKENRFNLADEEVVLNQFCPFYELRFSYDENGYVTKMANYEKDALYDCTAENCGNIGVSYFLFKNDENGGLLEFSVHNTKGQLSNLYWGWAKFTQVLDENGYVTEFVRYDQDDEFVGGKMVPITKYAYDESGSVIEERYFDKDRQPLNNPNDGAAIKQYKYDEFGHRTETLLFDKDMNPIES